MREIPRIPDNVGKGSLQRSKHFSISGPEGGVFRAKASLRDGQHTMEASLAIQEGTMKVLEVAGSITSAPHPDCRTAVEGMQNLVGMLVQPGLFREMQSRVGGRKGCIHMNELIRESVQLVAAHRNLTEIRRMIEAGFTDNQIVEWGDSVRTWTCVAVPGPSIPDHAGKGSLVRNKQFSITGPEDGVYQSKAALKDGQHTMEASMVVQEGTMKILAVEGAIIFAPHPDCKTAVGGLQNLVGMLIQPGLFSEMKSRVGGIKGCIHMNELIRESVQLVAAHRNLTELRRMREAGTSEDRIQQWGESVTSWTCVAVPGPLPNR
ncbi:MAG: DUF2889 domain-containing protein [Dehalococcoidia bacterium]|nr:DUF2889 domain-containing protein [Dehalococcoidia bacterium]